ncbi:unnamed protein product [Notodromas monacha]|uniref:Guanine nucleotide-binding protein G(s) subunit alpha n=1 Tax=Notodromas monacha TaxID=399045 RepID=A0A7R9BKA9_9CRUS|nr:unnamed protein product [Notodromas monacha]CAG0916223.1 unnamed protein product [Notodromas monacha]
MLRGCCAGGGDRIEHDEATRKIDKQLKDWNKTYRQIIKILLLEKLTYLDQLKRNGVDAMQTILDFMETVEPAIPLRNPRNEISREYFYDIDVNHEDFVFDKQTAEHLKCLWKDEGVQQAVVRENEYHLIDSARYILDKIGEIAQPDYVPSNQDILHCRRETTGLQKVEFSIAVPPKNGGGTQQFWMYDVGGQREYRHQIARVFADIQVVLFLVSSIGYDRTLREDKTFNRMEESLNFFTAMWESPYLSTSGFILFLNKQDILKEKISRDRGESLLSHYPEFRDYRPNSKDLVGDEDFVYLRARAFIRDKFLNKTRDPLSSNKNKKRRKGVGNLEQARRLRSGPDVYWHYTTATDTDHINSVFNAVNSMIIVWNLTTLGLI